MEIIEDLVEDNRKIFMISKFNNFVFYDDSIIVWCVYDVGKGKEIVLEKILVGNCKWKNICWGIIYLLFIVIFLVLNCKLCNIIDYYFNFLVNSV